MIILLILLITIIILIIYFLLNFKKVKKYKNEYIYSKDNDFIISEEEQEIIVKWISENYLRLDEIKKNSWMKSFDKLNDLEIPDIIWKIKDRIIKKEGLEDEVIDPEFRDAIGYMIGDSELQEHTDPSYYGLVHTRFNVYVQLPEEGGYPIYANNLYKLKERTYICCRAGIDKHLCSDVKGNKPRIMISYGFQLPYERVKNIKYNYD
jgi:hypothetical protein